MGEIPEPSQEFENWKAPETGGDNQEVAQESYASHSSGQFEDDLKGGLQRGIDQLKRSVDKTLDLPSSKKLNEEEWISYEKELDRLNGKVKLAEKAQYEIGPLLDSSKGYGKTVSGAIFDKIAEWQNSREYNSGDDYTRQIIEEDSIAPLRYLAEHLDDEALNTKIDDANPRTEQSVESTPAIISAS
ncbi:MAG TPA: hypothetical protein VMQ44_03500, partial [Candidatus Saccharimonadales bacterium]|nr:hypothetical protein [Candidatus Saccharimonadales bacterium]